MPPLQDDWDLKVRRDKRGRKGVRLGRTHVGWGVFAQQNYVRDGLIGEIEGTIIDDIEYGSDYCMDLGDSRCLEPSAPFRYMNHSCEPNCSFDWYDLTGDHDPEPRRRMFVTAIEYIKPGDELTIDYCWPASMAIPCRCHAATCRGWIAAVSELPEVLRRRNDER